ncbi:MAG TPA: hypothetical protein VEJ84_15980 [Acidimicrobiales bacterium]|nr:hypothetical protein [Acidimicrobiales bacterium]
MRTAMTEAALDCGEPSVEQFFSDSFAYLRVDADVEEMVAHAAEIAEQDLFVLRPRQ